MLKLYHFDRSPFAWKVRIVLAEKNVPYEGIVPQNKNEDPEFARLNPFRLTPVLLLESGKAIYESTVIAEYLEETHPAPAMLPRDPYERARVRMLEDAADQYLYPVIRALASSQYEYRPPLLIRKKASEVDHRALEEARVKAHEHLARIDRELTGRSWLGGDLFSLADAAHVPSLTGSLRLHGLLPDPKYPNIASWSARIAERPSCRAAAPREPARIVEA